MLEGVKIGGRWAVIYSKYDIGCALEKHQSADCLGYTHESALCLGRAAVLYLFRPSTPIHFSLSFCSLNADSHIQTGESVFTEEQGKMSKTWMLLVASSAPLRKWLHCTATAQEPGPQPVEVKVSPVESGPMPASMSHGDPGKPVIMTGCSTCCTGHFVAGAPQKGLQSSNKSWLSHFCYTPLPVPCECQSKCCCCCRTGCSCTCVPPIYAFFVRHDCDLRAPCCQQPCLTCDRANWRP